MRTILYGAEPLGIGTGRVEALSSYFARLCLERRVSPGDVYRQYLVERCPEGLVEDHPLRIGNYLSFGFSRFDLEVPYAATMSEVLGRLTGRPTLSRLTFARFAPWGWGPGPTSLGMGRARWCSSCLADWRDSARPLYAPLLWRFSCIDVCPVHRIRLLDLCMDCGRRQPIVHKRVPVGYCVHCGADLARRSPDSDRDASMMEPAERWSWRRSLALSRLLEWSSEGHRSTIGPEAFSDLLRSVMTASPELLFSGVGPAASTLGTSNSTLAMWLDGSGVPQLGAVLDVLVQLEVDPVRFFRGDAGIGAEIQRRDDAVTDLMRLAWEVREVSASERWPDLACDLDAFIADSTAVDLASLMRRNNVFQMGLVVRFPARSLLARLLRSERVARERRRTVERFSRIVEDDLGDGAGRSLDELAAVVGLTGGGLAYYVPDAVKSRAALRRARQRTCQPGLREVLRQRLREALNEPGGMSSNAIARELGLKDYVVGAVCPVEHKALCAKRLAERRSRWERYRAVMRAELSAESPRSVHALAGELGVPAHTLKRADRTLWRKLSVEPGRRRRVRRARDRDSKLAKVQALERHKARIREALELELSKAEPGSPRSVAVALGVPSSVVHHHWPDRCRDLIERRVQIREVLLARVGEALEEELTLALPRTPSRFAKDFGVDRAVLFARYPEAMARLRDVARGVRWPVRVKVKPGDYKLIAVLLDEVKAEAPRSLRALGRDLGVDPQRFRMLCPEGVDLLLEARERLGKSQRRRARRDV